MISLSEQTVLDRSRLTPDDILKDYRLAYQSRQASLIGRREVMSGKAKFGIFGDGKEVPQLAMARVFQKGDFRSGYYRDQTFMFAIQAATIKEFFAQLYAHADVKADPASGGRQMNAHFASRILNPDGSWRDQTEMMNSAADLSPTASQMPRLVGLGYASRLYREIPELRERSNFSHNGREIAFGTIGNASCAEGHFWEAVNAIGVLHVPVILSIWDDDFGISVPNEVQLTKGDIGSLIEGFRRKPDQRDGFDIYRVVGWDYPELITTYQTAAKNARENHTPAIIHVTDLTQPQGHSTSGSHERYKSKKRLDWEREHDCLLKMRTWMLAEGLVSEAALNQFEAVDRAQVESDRAEAWESFQTQIKKEINEFIDLLDKIEVDAKQKARLVRIRERLRNKHLPYSSNLMTAVRETILSLRPLDSKKTEKLKSWRQGLISRYSQQYASHLYNQSRTSALQVPELKAVYSGESPMIQGYQIMNSCFDRILAKFPEVVAFGEDVGKIGDVNQGFAGLQKKYGDLRVSDTGIREATIVGQAIGLAMRGIRPIAEIQYLDYLLYGLQTLSDDLATLHWRTVGGQSAPVIIRTRGHRLEGIWHSGSPMGGVLNLLRGLHILVPRNMTQAAGFYNTLLQGDDPALVVEVLNGYRRKEKLPDNIGEFTIPIGIPEVLREGKDLTLVTYGASCSLAIEAADLLQRLDVDLEIIDVRSLLPFDLQGSIAESLQKTNHLVILDEDVPGGASAFILREVLETQSGFEWLDAAPRTLTAKAHRPAYGSDGNYWSKPNLDEIVELCYQIMQESSPKNYPPLF